jgi:PAS domain S-box-containing protein
LQDGKFDADKVLQGWIEKEGAALKHGFEGLRLSGNTFWVERSLWNSFVDYEEKINSVIGEHHMIALCTYCLKNCSGTDVVDVVRNHVGTLIKQGKKWSLVEDATLRRRHDDRWAATVSSIGDAVVATDTMGKITFMNPVAQKLTGWQLSDAQDKPLSQIFKIINAFTRQEVESPVTRVINEGLIVGLANHTILIRKDGSEIPIDDSGAPIKDKDGESLVLSWFFAI